MEVLLYGYDTPEYGHFGQGLVHCRINFELTTAGGIRKYRAFLDDATDLVVRHGPACRRASTATASPRGGSAANGDVRPRRGTATSSHGARLPGALQSTTASRSAGRKASRLILRAKRAPPFAYPR